MTRQNNNKTKHRWFYRSLTIVAFGLIGVGLYILLMPRWIRYNQDKITKQLLDQLESQHEPVNPDDDEAGTNPEDNLIWVDPDAWVNSDEEVDYFIPDPSDPDKYIQISPPSGDNSGGTHLASNPDDPSQSDSSSEGSEAVPATPTPATGGQTTGSTEPVPPTTGSTTLVAPTNNKGQIGLEGIGKLVMNKINVNMPIVTGLTRVHLRYAAAHYEITPMIGDKGITAIFAHRSPAHGRDLNRLNEIVVGDRFEIVRNNKTYHYITEQNIIVEPSQVLEHIFSDYNDDSYVMLVTCHPIPTWKQRMLVIARLVEVTG